MRLVGAAPLRVGAIAAVLSLLSGCSAGGGAAAAFGPRAARDSSSSTSPIAHVVLLVQENRTFNDFFATFPGADGVTTATVGKDKACSIGKPKTIALTESPLVTVHDLNHSYQGYNTARDNGAMDGFDRVLFGGGTPECTYPYQYTDPLQIVPYWDLAQQYALAEHMFTTQGSSSFTAHQDLIAGGTLVESDEALVNLPTCSGFKCIWGCDAPPSTHTSLISQSDALQLGKGPFPCLTYETLRDLLDAKGVSWKYYVPKMCCSSYGRLMSAFDAISAVRYGPEWKTNVITPQTKIFGDIAAGTLPAMSWVIPETDDSDHPGLKVDDGPSWVASVVNAIGESQYWDSTAIIVVWDDWGGLYDNLNPRQLGYGGLGFRVPALVVSPYARAGYISPTQYEFGSILKYVEQNWGLGSLGTSDERATSIADCFDYSQSPIAFRPIASSRSRAYFLHEKASYRPVDTDL